MFEKTNCLPVQQQAVYTEPMQILLQIAVMFAAQKLPRLRRQRVNERQTRARFSPFKNLPGPV